jgi:hypothetical protein
MTHRALIVAVVAAALVSALIASLVTIKWHQQEEAGHHGQVDSAEDFHHWLHENLELTESQEKAIPFTFKLSN